MVKYGQEMYEKERLNKMNDVQLETEILKTKLDEVVDKMNKTIDIDELNKLRKEMVKIVVDSI